PACHFARASISLDPNEIAFQRVHCHDAPVQSEAEVHEWVMQVLVPRNESVEMEMLQRALESAPVPAQFAVDQRYFSQSERTFQIFAGIVDKIARRLRAGLALFLAVRKIPLLGVVAFLGDLP